MSQPPVSFENARDAIVVLPLLEPRQTVTNIHALVIDLVDKLTVIPSQQSADLGYSSLVQQNELYALATTNHGKIGQIQAHFEKPTQFGQPNSQRRQRFYIW